MSTSLEHVTPVVLTYNEAPNIGRTLAGLSWARRIVVVDSFSDDETCAIASAFPAVSLFQRKFDTHASQWNYATRETGIDTEWTLALDADYMVSPELAQEMAERITGTGVDGYRARFEYCVRGRKLRGTAYPPVTVLFRTGRGQYSQDGHTQRLAVEGRVEPLRHPILHDDRKPLTAWLGAQVRYTRLEADKLLATPFGELGFADRLRRSIVLAPPAMLGYCLFVKGNVLDGWPGIYYALQRTASELMLSLFLLERRLARLRRAA